MGRTVSGQSAGFTLTELIVALGITSVMVAALAMIAPRTIRDARADGGLEQVISQLQRAKELAVTERRDMEVRFIAPDEIQIWRQEVPVALGRTQLSTVRLENGMQFLLMPGLPDTPDGYGNGAAIEFSGANTLLFRSEGMFTDGNANLDPLNGTVFLGVPNRPETARAVTVFGPTALIRGFRWTGQQWVER